MYVRELIARLQALDPDAVVVLVSDPTESESYHVLEDIQVGFLGADPDDPQEFEVHLKPAEGRTSCVALRPED
jgi:hypothetical protein